MHTYQLAKNLADRGIEVSVYYSNPSNKNKIENSSKHNIEGLKLFETKFPKLPPIFGRYIIASFLFSKRLYESIDLNDFDSIYAQGFTAWYFLKKEPFNPKIISNLHGLNMFQNTINCMHLLQQKLYQIPALYIIKRSSKLVSLGGRLTDILNKYKEEKSTIFELPNGIENSWVANATSLDIKKNTPISMSFVGRYEKIKGIEELQYAIMRLPSSIKFSMNFIGPIPRSKRIKHSSVNYLGMINDRDTIKKVLTTSDILVCPSYSEGMPNVILEGMACGCAIIATDVGAVRTMVSDDNGWLISADNISDELLKAFNEAGGLPGELLRRKKLASLEKVKKHFIWDQIIDKTIESLTWE